MTALFLLGGAGPVAGELWVPWGSEEVDGYTCKLVHDPSTGVTLHSACIKSEGKMLVCEGNCDECGALGPGGFCYHMENRGLAWSEETYLYAETVNHGGSDDCTGYEACNTPKVIVHQAGTDPDPPCHIHTSTAQGFWDPEMLLAAGGEAQQEGEACPE